MTEIDTDTDTTPTDAAGSSAPASGVTMYTTSWCGFCARLKRGLQSEGIDFDEVNIEEVDGAAEEVTARNGGNRTVPTLVFADGSALTNPSVADVKEQLARLA
jgi:mycoredoxin